MKIEIIKSVIAVSVSLLLAYGFYEFSNSKNVLLLSVGCFLCIAISLLMTIGIRLELPRTTIMVRSVSGIFLFVFLTNNLIFSFIEFSKPLYIIISGILLLLYFLIIYSIAQARQ